MEKLVSVVILTYKNFGGIEKNLNSIFEQDYPNIEIIISDDCSGNFDSNYIENLLKKHFEIEYFNGVTFKIDISKGNNMKEV